MRLIKLLNRAEGVRTLLWTFIKSFQVSCPARGSSAVPGGLGVALWGDLGSLVS